MSTFDRILLPVDFSDHCDVAAQHAGWFAQQSGGTVHLVHVIANPADDLYTPEEAPYWVMVEHAEKKALEMLEASAANCLPTGCPSKCHVEVGDPYDNILKVARAIRPDVIILSTHGRTGIAHLVMGSVAEKIVRHSTCPVFVVPRRQ